MLLCEPINSLDILILFPGPEHLSLLNSPLIELSHLFAQQIEDPDLLGNIQRSWANFIQSGQVWALGIGFVLGYMFRSFTSF
ncbi:MAG: hypothetical protein AAGF26_00855 [Cyanobacteria bacterium P01_G01_bin.49]